DSVRNSYLVSRFSFYYGSCDVHSLPTRRSSDLKVGSLRKIALFREEASVSPCPLRIKPASVVVTRASMLGPDSSASPFSTGAGSDRKSTRLNSSHVKSSYAVFCLKKKKKNAIAE